MAPISLQAAHDVDHIADLKAKLVDNHVEVEAVPRGPVSDDYMYDFKYNHELPTTTLLSRDVPPNVDAFAVAMTLRGALSSLWSSGDALGFTDLFLDYGEFLSPRYADIIRSLA